MRKCMSRGGFSERRIFMRGWLCVSLEWLA